jgi:hypothetical protein
MEAASRGDVDLVRFLNKRGFRLWGQAEAWKCSPAPLNFTVEEAGKLVRYPLELVPVWKAFRYGAVHGAPVTPELRQLFWMKRQRTRMVLCCFKAAARLSQGPGSTQQLDDWAAMAALPSEVVQKILILAHLEIPERVVSRAPRCMNKCSVAAEFSRGGACTGGHGCPAVGSLFRKLSARPT